MSRPPRLAARLVELVVPSPYGADLLVELDDAYVARAAGGRMAQMRAAAWYWGQVVSGNTLRLRAAATRLRSASFSRHGRGQQPSLPGGFDDVRFAMRSLLNAPRYSLAAILALALGIGAVTSIYSTVGGMLRNPLPFEDLDSLLAVGEDNSRATIQEDAEAWVHAADYAYLEDLPVFTSVAGLRLRLATLTAPGEPLDVVIYEATANYFESSGLRALHGRLPSAEQMRNGGVAVLSHEFWQRRFGGRAEIIGEALSVADTAAVVAAVLPPGATYPAGTDLYLPLRLPPDVSNSFEHGRLTVLARLAPGVSLGQARAALATTTEAIARVAPDSHAQFQLAAMPVREIATFGSSRLIGFLMGAAVFLLLLVCANVASLQLARTTARGSEIAVRVALGSSRWRLIRQLLVESLCLSLTGAALGSALALWGSGLLRQQLGHPSIRFFFYGADGIGVDGGVLTFAILVATFAAIVSGLAPALHGSRADLSDVLKPGSAGGGSGGGNRLRNTFVVIEIVLAVVLLAGAAYMSRSVGSLVAFERGLDGDASLLAVRLRGEAFAETEQRDVFVRTTSEAIAALPDVSAVGVSSTAPGVQGTRPAEFAIDGREATETRLLAEPHLIDSGYFDALGVPLVAGRAPSRAEVLDSAPYAVISRALASQHWPEGDAIGSRIRFGDGPWLTVTGIAADVSRAWNDSAPARAIYRPYTHAAPSSVVFSIASSNPDAVLPAARARIWEADARMPINSHRSVADAIAERSLLYRPVMSMATMFATSAFLLALAGIYSITSYAAARRTWEMGVRMALGASTRDVTRLFVRQALRLVLLGLALGLPLAWMLTRALGALGRGMTTSTDSTAVLAALSVAVLAAAALASYLPARRAGSADPISALRTE